MNFKTKISTFLQPKVDQAADITEKKISDIENILTLELIEAVENQEKET